MLTAIMEKLAKNNERLKKLSIEMEVMILDDIVNALDNRITIFEKIQLKKTGV